MRIKLKIGIISVFLIKFLSVTSISFAENQSFRHSLESYSMHDTIALRIKPRQVDSNIPGQDNWASGSLMHPYAVTIGNARVGISGSTEDHNPNGQLILAGSPDGPNTNGCLLCMFDTVSALNIAGISGGGSSNWINGPLGISQYGSADSPVEYIMQDNANMQVMNLKVADYTATEIILASAMTTDQMARIHYGMYAISNSIDTSLATPTFSASNNLPSPNYYASTVISVIDRTHIKVSGWAVPGAGNSTSGQVPSTSNLDTKWTDFGIPTIGIGGRTNTSAINWVTYFTTTNSWLNNYENEIDILGDPGFAAGRMRIHGLTMTYQGPTPSADSYALNLNTIALPVQLHMEVKPTGYGVQSNSFITKGNSGVSVKGDIWESFEHAAFADSTSNMRLVGWLKKETNTKGWPSSSFSIGLHVDGIQGEAKTGSKMGRLTFNPLLFGTEAIQVGGWALGNGNSYAFGSVSNEPTVLNGGYLGFQEKGWSSGISFPTIQATSPSKLNIRDNNGKNVTLNTYELEVINSLIVPFKRPPSSRSPCNQGQIEDDENYHYVCVSKNRWKRAILSDF